MPTPDEDFRTNLIIDQNNPILIMKAWRDHDPAGWAYLAAPHGEDALTWNVFRFLDLRGPREAVQRFFQLHSPVEEFLFWGCDPDGHSDTQQTLSILLRGLDGCRRGTMTEPDLVLLTATEVCFVECKLSFAPAPWSARTTPVPAAAGTTIPQQDPGWKKRWGDYRARPAFQALPPDPGSEERAVYQLVRNAIYARLMAEELGKERAVVLSLTSRLQADLYPDTERQYRHLRELCGAFAEVADLRYWEDLLPLLPPEPGGKIRTALEIVGERVGPYIDGQIRRLRGSDAAARREGEDVIRHLRPERLTPHAENLVSCLGTPNAADVRGTVAAAIRALGADAVPALRKALTDPNTERRLACITALAHLGPSAGAAVPDLQQLLITARLRQEVKTAIREALRQIVPDNNLPTAGPAGG